MDKTGVSTDPDIDHLVDVIMLNPLVKKVVQVVEKLDDLVGGAVGGDGGEPHDVAEEDARVVEYLRLGHLSLLHLLDDGLGQEGAQELLSLFLLLSEYFHLKEQSWLCHFTVAQSWALAVINNLKVIDN